MSENNHTSMKYILMAGGTASRMWPLSRNDNPKPFLQPNPLGGQLSTFQQMVQHLLDGGVDPQDLYPVVAQNHRHFVAQQTPMIPSENVLYDPVPRDNAAAIGLAAMTVDHRHPGSIIAIVWAADHYLTKPKNFTDALALAGKIVADHDTIVQINVRADAALTHVGWIEVGEPMMEKYGSNIFQYKRHVEKPDLATARRFLREKRWLFHTGYRVCRADSLLELYGQYAPDIYGELMRIKEALGTPQQDKVLAEIYPTIRKESIDYAVFEHVAAGGQAVIDADLGWIDPGDFGSLYLNMPKDEAGDAINGEGDVLIHDSMNSLVMAPKNTAVAVIGLEDVAVVVTDDAVLVMDRNRAAEVKKIVQELKDSGLDKYL